MSDLKPLIQMAAQNGASDLHIEASSPIHLRVRGKLVRTSESVSGDEAILFGKELLGSQGWNEFLERGSADLSRTIAGARCRINILKSVRGVGFAIRLLRSYQSGFEETNLHSDFRNLLGFENGLVLVCGATGSGKSTTMAAFVEELNRGQAKHIITIESPIEYHLKSKNSFIRQREVGRHTTSFEQGIVDSMREDPDVLVIGEMRTAETMRLTMNVAETGHLVLATMHSSTPAEAISRVAMSFPAEIQSSILGQLADSLRAIVCQKLVYLEDHKIQVPLCEIVVMNHAVRTKIRQADFAQIISATQTGADEGMWTFARYQKWIDQKSNWYRPSAKPVEKSVEEEVIASEELQKPVKNQQKVKSVSVQNEVSADPDADRRIEIPDMEGDLNELADKIEED